VANNVLRARDNIVSRTRYRSEIKETLKDLKPSEWPIEMMVDQRLTMDAVDDLAEAVTTVSENVEANTKVIGVLRDKCHVLSPDAKDPDVEEIEAKGKVALALANHWGKILLTIVGMILAFLGGSYIGGA